MAHGDAGEADAGGFTGATDGEGRPARVRAIFAYAHLGREGGDVGQQFAHLARGVAVVERGDEFDGGLELFEVGGKLDLDGSVEHDFLLGRDCTNSRFVIPGLTRNPVEYFWIPAFAGMTGLVVQRVAA